MAGLAGWPSSLFRYRSQDSTSTLLIADKEYLPHIDPALRKVGWGVVEGSRIRCEFPIAPGRIEGKGRRGKPLTADYVLEYRGHKLAVIEAKAWGEQLTEGVGVTEKVLSNFDVDTPLPEKVGHAGTGQAWAREGQAPLTLSGPAAC